MFAAISDADGDIYVDGEAFAPLSGTLQEQYCDDQTNADNVYAEQCSSYEDPKSSYGGGLEVCGDTVEGSIRQGPTAWTDLHDLKRDNRSFKIEEYWEQGQTGRQFRIRQVTETMRLRSDFFYAGVQQGGRKDSGTLSGQTELHQSAPGAANGVCSRGEVDEGQFKFGIDTSVGSAPSNCSFE
jgi:hypothetical protein